MEKKIIRVLHTGLSPNRGGIEQVVFSWACHLPLNVHFDFINVHPEDLAFQDELLKLNCGIYRIPSRKSAPIESNKMLTRIIRDGNYDYVHNHMMSFAGFDPLLIAQYSKGTVAIAHAHSASHRHLSMKYRALDRIGRSVLSSKTLQKIACGEDAGKDMFRDDDFTVIPNGIDFSVYRYSPLKRELIRNQYGIPADSYVIGHVGRSDKVKNYPFLIKLFSEVNNVLENAVLLLIGNCDMDGSIRKIVSDYHLEKKIVFTGVQSELSQFYSAMDVFVLPSQYEGVSVAMIEAQASGLPCVVSEFVSPESDISGNVSFVSIADIKDGVKKILELYNKNQDRNSVSLDTKYDIHNSSRAVFEFYESHLSIM